jgi:thioredoxin 2
MDPRHARAVTVRCRSCGRRNRVDLSRIESGPKCADCRAQIRLDRPIGVSEEEFRETVAAAGVPVLVDFYADWCGPCRLVAPALEEMALRHRGNLLILKVDSDQCPDLTRQHGIRGGPTLLLFDEAREVRRHVGAATFAQLEQLVGFA